MSISAVGNSLYNFFVQQPGAYWLNKKESEVTAGDAAKVYVGAALWPITIFTGCDQPGDVCQASKGMPEIGSPYAEPTTPVKVGDPVTFTLAGASSKCPGADLQATFSIGPYINEPMDKNDDGSFSKTVPAQLWGPPATFTVTDMANGKSVKTFLYNVPTVVSGSQTDDICAAWPGPDPQIEDNQSIAGRTAVIEGETARYSFPLSAVKACDNTTADLKVSFIFSGTSGTTILPASSDGTNYFVNKYFNPGSAGSAPVIVSLRVEDALRGTSTDYQNSIPVYVSQDPVAAACGTNPQPKAFTVTPADPATNYDVASGIPVEWQIWAANCDGTTAGLSAVCNFGPLGQVSGNGNNNGVITISKALTQRLTGNFGCSIIGSNDSILANGVVLYPPYYASQQLSACENNPKPVASTVIGPNPLNNYDIASNTPVVWQIYGENCDDTKNGLSATCDFGSLGTVTGTGNANGIITISKALTQRLTGYFRCDITGSNHEVLTNGVTLYPPYYTSPQTDACQSDPKPMTSTVVGPNPGNNYDIASNTPVVWQIYSENCDDTKTGLSATCDFGPLGTVSGNSNASGIITISKALTQRLTGNFRCDIKGSNNQVLANGAALYPPYYTSPQTNVCDADPKPITSTVVGPNPGTSYDINSNIPVIWQVYAENCDNTKNGLSATCDFGPLGTVAGTGNANGIITIQKILTQRVTGNFACDVKGSNNQVRVNGAVLYPPYYTSPQTSVCDSDPRPKTFTVTAPNPATGYNPASGSPVGWQIWAANCDGTTNGLSAICSFGPLGTASGNGNANGIIDIQKVLTQRLTGSFNCNVTGKNASVLVNETVLYPPYYTTP